MSPNTALLEKDTKEQLLKIVEHYGIDIPSTHKRLKGSVKAVLITNLEEINSHMEGAEESDPSSISVTQQGLTFEQRKEFMYCMQMTAFPA